MEIRIKWKWKHFSVAKANVCPSVCYQNPSTACNHHPSSFNLHHSSFILHILHSSLLRFATFKLLSLLTVHIGNWKNTSSEINSIFQYFLMKFPYVSLFYFLKSSLKQWHVLLPKVSMVLLKWTALSPLVEIGKGAKVCHELDPSTLLIYTSVFPSDSWTPPTTTYTLNEFIIHNWERNDYILLCKDFHPT